MSLAIVYSRAQVGIDAPLVSVEVHLSNGLPGLSIVGLPEAAVKESKDRVRGAILNSRFEFPVRRITINLAPADLPKEGGRFDLPIALGILEASGQVPLENLKHHEYLGELALGGELRWVRGVLPAALACREAGRALLAPKTNADEATLASRGLGRSLSPITGCCSWTSCPSSTAGSWRCCASPWSRALSPSPGPPGRPISPPAFSWWLR
jgi:magnesium chelatase family protein